MRFTLIVFLFGSLSLLQAHACIQSISSDTKKIDSLFLKYNELIDTNPTSAITMAKKALDNSLTSGYPKGELRAHYSLGRAFFMTLQIDSSVHHLKKGIALGTELRDTLHLILCEKWMGTIFRYQSNYQGAIKQYQKALELAEKAELKSEIPKLTQNIATIFLDLGQFDKAIFYYKESLANMNNPYFKSICSTNLGLAYLKNKQFEMALASFEKGLQLCKFTDNPHCEISPLEMITHAYIEQGQNKKALKYGLEVLKKRKAENSKPNLVNAYNQVGLIYLNMREFDNALEYFEHCLSLTEYMQPSMLPYIHANIALAHEGLEQYQLAVKHLWRFQDTQDSLKSRANKKHTKELLAKFDSEKKEQEILLLQKEKELQVSELNQQTLLRNIAIAGVVITILILIVIRDIYSQKIKAQNELATKQQEINEQKTKELIRENELKASKANIDGQEQERKRIAQELHDGIAGNLASMKLNLSELNLGSKKSALDRVVEQMDATYDHVRSLSHHLMPPSVRRSTLIHLIEKYLNELKPGISFSIDFNYHHKAVIDQISDDTKLELYRITQELTNNIVKHANPTHVDIQLNKNGEELNLMIEDDGVGFDLKKTSAGIGLKSIASRVSQINGHINIDSNPNHGTTVSIDIPLQNVVIHEI